MKRLVLISLAVLIVGSLAIGCAPDEEEGEEGFGGEIVGIDAGAGVMEATESAIDTYDNLADFDLVESSDAAMVAELDSHYQDEEWVAVTGWTPHWKFAEYDLKFLEDPEGVYGDEETINALVREGLGDDEPVAHEFFDEYFMTDDEISEVMELINETGDEEGSAEEWVEDNMDVVEEWLPEDDGGGETIELGYIEWECAIAQSYTAQYILEEHVGYEVDIISADAGPIYSDIASGDTDAMVASWQPITQASYIEEYGDDLEDLGPVYEGARIGMVVPEYVDIDSIEDIEG